MIFNESNISTVLLLKIATFIYCDETVVNLGVQTHETTAQWKISRESTYQHQAANIAETTHCTG